MSRSPPAPYGFATHSGVPPFYYDEHEGYVGDYAESDMSERSHLLPPNATEIYRKKPLLAAPVAAPHEHYRQNMYMPPNYYYEPVPPTVPQQVRRPAVPATYRRHIPLVDDRARYYTAAPLEEGFRDAVVYSSPQIATVRRPAPSPQPTSASMTRPAVRRHPVTVRTPKYIRRTPVSNICKKPSALCLPLACQPDPAVRRARKNSDELNCSMQTYVQQGQPSRSLGRTHSVPMHSNPCLVQPQVTHVASFPRNLHMSQSDVDAVLARYETVFEGNALGSGSEKYESTSSKSSLDGKPSKGKLAITMKPKLPPSLKQKQEHVVASQVERPTSSKGENLQNKINTSPHVEHLEVEEITTEVLDSMLTELMNTGSTNNVNNNRNQENKNESHTLGNPEYSDKINTSEKLGNMNAKPDESQFPKTYNYQDHSPNRRVNTYQRCEGKDRNTSAASIEQEMPPPPRLNINSSRVETTQSNTPQQVTPSTNCSKAGDENGVTELHRSKSYIVNLIDRALSKELGTCPPNERFPSTSKESGQLHARKAMGLMNKHFDKMDKGLCLEITQTLTDSLISNATAPPPAEKEEKQETACSCNIHDEPLYIKQLRQLRWGHLRHIQREVRRLEDLERFLDSCSSGMLK